MEHVIIDIRGEYNGKLPANITRMEWGLLFFVCASTFAATAYLLLA
jgi:hypothetical protein